MAEDNDIQFVTTEEIPLNNMAIFQQEKAAIERAMVWAKQFPRNELKIKNALIALVANDKELAASCTYSVPRSGNPTGPSVVLAKLFLRKYGNLRVESRIVGFDATHVTSEATICDLETNYGVRCQVRRSIMTKTGARYDETTATTTGMAGCSIALRNATFQVVEPSLVKAVHDAAKNKVLGKCSTKEELISVREKFVDGLKQLYKDENLTDAEIAAACGKKLVEHIDKDGCLTLASIEEGLRKGEMDFYKVFRSKEQHEPTTFAAPEAKTDERVKQLIKSAKLRSDLKKLESHIKTNELRILFDEAYKVLPEK